MIRDDRLLQKQISTEGYAKWMINRTNALKIHAGVHELDYIWGLSTMEYRDTSVAY